MSGKESVVGTLIVNLAAVTKNFSRGVTGARKDLKGFKAEADTTGAALKFLKGSLATAFAGFTVSAIVGKFTQVANALDGVAEAAKRVGISAGSLQSLNFAGQLSGVGAETIEKSLIKMSRGISEVAKGSGSAKSVLRELTLSAAELAKLPADAQLFKIAGAMEGVTNQSDRLRISVALFGKAGADMLPMLSGGAAGLREFVAEAKQLGIVFDVKEVEKVEQMNDALDRLKAVFGTAGQGLVIEAAPSLTQAAKDLKDAAIGLRMRGAPDQRTSMSRYMYGLDSMISSMTAPAYAAGRGVKSYLRNSENWWVQRDLRNGIAAGSPAVDVGQSKGWTYRDGQAFLDEADDATLAARDERETRQRMLSIYKRKGFAALESGMSAVFGPSDPEQRKNWKGHQGIIDAAKALKDVQDNAREFLQKWALRSLIDRPDLTGERLRKKQAADEVQAEVDAMEKDRLARWARAKEIREANERLQRTPNAALERGSAEAFRAIAENRYPRLQLEEAKKSRKALESLDRNMRFTYVGVER